MSENNSNILAPILGQYGIKPADFILKLKDTFIITVKNQHDIINDLLTYLVFSFILKIGKNNSYAITFKKFSYSYLYNTLAQRRKRVFLNVLFLYKLFFFDKKKNNLYFLYKKILKLRFINIL
jgi:hypothetical protein